MEITYRTINQSDDNDLALIIKSTLIEYNSATDGTVFTDEGTNALSTTFTDPRSRYFVAYSGEELLGGAGINLLPGESDEVCELQRMFLKPAARGKGIGKKLMVWLAQKAKQKGYQIIWLDAMDYQPQAFQFYKKQAFEYHSHWFLPYELMHKELRKISQLYKKLI